jgi:hypothetical protein
MIFPFAASGQTSTAITGRVSDQTGAVIPKASVTAHNELTNQNISTVTTSTGDFSFTNLRPGLYDVSSTAQGFDTATETAINLHLDAVATVKLVLKPGSSTINVTVNADETQLDQTHATRGEAFTQDELEQSPFNSGNPLMLVNSAPAVTFQGSNTQSAQWVRPFDHQAINQFSVNGGIADSNDFQLDGSPNNSITFGARDIGTVPPTASVQEMKFIQNPYDAQYGHTGGGIFDIVTKYGGNTLHGQVYENARRTWIDANTELNDSQGLAKGSDNRNQFGFELDGPVMIPHFYNGHDKTFFAMQFERYNEKDPQTMVNSVPECSPGYETVNGTTETCTKTVSQTGDFSSAYYIGTGSAHLPVNIYNPFTITTPYDWWDPRTQFSNNQIPSTLINKTTQAILSYLPMPNRVTPSNLVWGENNYVWAVSATLPYDSATIRLDRNFGDKDRTYIRLNWTKNWQINADAQVMNSLPGTAGRFLAPLVFQTHFGIADWQHTFSANSLFDIHLSFQRFAYNQNQGPSPFDLSNIGLSSLASSVTEQVFPQISIGGHGGVTEFGNNADNGGNKLTISNTIAAMPMWTYVHGAHTMKVGVDYRMQRSSTYYGGAASGEFNNTDWYTQQYGSCLDCLAGQGSGLASFMLGIGDGGSIYTGVRQYFTYPYAAPFFQDDWKVTHKLTINLGLRWDLQGAPTESAHKIVGDFDGTAVNPVNSAVVATGLLPTGTTLTGGLTYAGVNGQRRSLFNTNRFLIQPRVGFNYALNDKTVIRGGVGTTYMQFTGQGYDQGFTATTNYVSSSDWGTTVNGALLSDPFPTLAKPVGSSLGLESSLGNSFDVVNPNFKIPGVVNYSLGVERQIGQRTSVDVSYVGNRGVNLDSQDNLNHISASYSASCNLEMGATAATYENCINTTGNRSVANPFQGVDAFSTTKTGNLLGYYTNGTLNASVFSRRYPEFGDITQTEQNDGYTEYDSLQAVISHHWRDALTFHGNFVWSKQMDGGGWADEVYRIRQHYIDQTDRRWRWAANADWHIPVGRGRTFLGGSNRLVDAAVGNWVMGAIYTYEAGTPAPLTRGGPSYGLEVVHTQHYGVHNRTETQRVIRGMSKCVGWYDPNPSVNDAGGLSANNAPYTLGDVNPNDYAGCAVNGAGTGHVYDFIVRPQYAAVQNVSDNGVRTPRGQNLDLSMSKSFSVWREAKLQLRFEGYNVMNHPQWRGEDYWSYAWDSGSHFGTINKYYDGQTNIPRQVQLSGKIIW